MKLASPNFAFLEQHDPLLVRVAAGAERYCLEDPVVCLTKLRQLGEMLARHAAAYTGLDVDEREDQAVRLRTLEERNVVTREVALLFHRIRQAGNRAVHDHEGTASEALHQLKMARQIAVWFHRAFSAEPDFRPDAFMPPPEPFDAEQGLKEELERLRSRLAEIEEEAARAHALTAEEIKRRQKAEAQAAQAYEELEVALTLAEETEAENQRYEVELAELRAHQAALPEGQRLHLLLQAQQAGEKIDLDEFDTRRLVDQQLRDAGWEADTENRRYSKGVRPQKGINQAIAEWPTDKGPADYVLFIGLTPIAIVEAKRHATDVPGVIDQAKRYSRAYVVKAEEQLPEGGPWEDFKIPFLFATNGRPYLKQIETKSGIWFLDARRPTNHRRALQGWYTPTGLAKLFEQNLAEAEQKLQDRPVDLPGLRPYQIEAINAIEDGIVDGRQHMLVAMATGTGKTRTALALLYRLIKFGRFRRILFLVDRTALGEQAANAFKDVKMEGLLSFSDIYDLKELGDITPDSDTRVHISTVQGMVKRLLYGDENTAPVSVDQYDCIVVDECHRGYLLDRELSDTEITFRSQSDYISKYRRVVEYFDAVRIGLTATPALHTVEIFGRPVYQYSYRQAVIDGYLVDHLPPFGIVTQLAQDGIHWEAGNELKVYNPTSGTIELTTAPDDVDVDIDRFNSLVVTENFNRAVIGRLVQEIDPYLPGKTLVFCVTDDHADMVVDLFKEAYDEIRDDAVSKITGAADRPGELIRHFRNEKNPKIAVTVDLVTTGIDVPSITNLVFLRRVKSRILYEQMLGRATRLCPDLFGPGEHKEYFRIFDAVDLYGSLQEYTDMKPVVVQPQITFEQLAGELHEVEHEDALQTVIGQILAKLHRKRGVLEQYADEVELHTGKKPGDLLDDLRQKSPQAVRDLFLENPDLAAFLDRIQQETTQYRLISEHEDAVAEVHYGFGEKNERPEDYLEGFGEWIHTHLNEIPALIVVTRRPRDLTRADLKQLKLELDKAGFTEPNLRTAWHETRNEDIAAGIIGFIRSQALGSPLVPYGERVDHALQRILKNRDWTGAQRQWLQRIAQQIKTEIVVDREAFNRGRFRDFGGFTRIDKMFDGGLETVLGDLHEEIWRETAA